MSRVDRALLVWLGVDGFIFGLLSVVFLDVYVGSLAMPVSAGIGAVLNCVLLYLAALYTGGPARYVPLAGWVIAVGVGLFSGPGGDVLAVGDWRVLLLVFLGAGLPAVLSWSGRLPQTR